MNALLVLINLLSAYQIVWYNTEITIPLGENVFEHFESPYIEVYQSGKKITTTIDYQRGVNHTSLTVVNSNHVKTYYIDYKVYLNDLGMQSTQTITFKIIDETEPTFLYLPEINMPVKSKKLTEKEIMAELIYEDNYYDSKELIVKIQGLEAVNINIPGNYPIVYELIDPSLNIARVNSFYRVFNNVIPEIKAHLPIEVSVGNRFYYQNFFTFIDSFNSALTIDVNDELVNTFKIGTYQVIVTVTNGLGLSNTGSYQVEVVDKTKPTLTVKEQVTVNYLDSFDYRSLIINVSDNYDDLVVGDVTIVGYVDFKSIGKYELIFTVKDSSNNEISKKTIVEVKDLERPNIVLREPLQFSVGKEVTNFNSYFEITDNYDDINDLKITYHSKEINFKVIGNYYLYVEVIDSAKNKVTNDFLVSVIDLEPPTIEINFDEFIFIDQYGNIEDNYYKKYFIINDNYYSYNDINIVISDRINYFASNRIFRNFMFIDPSDNYTVIENIEIVIIETRPPIINLKISQYKHYLGNEKVDLNDFISELYNFDNTTNNLVLVIEDNINYSKVGLYEVSYKAYNENINNLAIKTLKFYIDFTQAEISEVNNLKVNIGETINELAGIVLSKDVSHYQVIPANVDTSTAGIKQRKIILYDPRGNIEIINQQIEVLANNKEKSYITNIIITTIGLFGGGIYLILNKRRNNLF